jgi:hypothetical protein
MFTSALPVTHLMDTNDSMGGVEKNIHPYIVGDIFSMLLNHVLILFV